MLRSCKRPLPAALLALFLLLAPGLFALAQARHLASITGIVEDPTGAVVPGATVEIQNPASGFNARAVTDQTGKFAIARVPFHRYHVSVKEAGFADYAEDVELRSAAGLTLTIRMQLAQANQTVTVEAGSADLLRNTPTFQTSVSRGLIEKLPTKSTSSSVSALVTLTTPGVSADSNGLFHGLGDHAENSFSVDGQPITDQQSKVFSNQIPQDSIQSMKVISGAPPAEYGDKTSLVIEVTTRSGQGVRTPHGSVTGGYGSFGTSTGDFNISYGGAKWGNFLAVSGLRSGRFLDAPEFRILHDKGNEENVFDRIDLAPRPSDTMHLNLQFTRSWFQTPNSFDQQTHYVCQDTGAGNQCQYTYQMYPLGVTQTSNFAPADQRSQIRTFNIAPAWTHVLSNSSLFTVGAFLRHDEYQYFPSANPYADYSPNLQSESVRQYRTLTNAGVRGEFSYVKGIHNVKAGVVYQHTFLDERDFLEIVDPNMANLGATVPFRGHADIKELGLYLQDSITKGDWNFNLGMRGDIYNGLTSHAEAQPRLGAAYNVRRTGTVLRLSYARTMETPFNENLVLSSVGCSDPQLNPLLNCSSAGLTPLAPGWRNEFHVGLEQSFGKYLVVSGEYIWKYTHHAYDFSVLGNTPITFPVEWERSKIPGFAGSIRVRNYHGFSLQTVFSGVAARFFNPQVGGAGATPTAPGGVFRIDHDEKFNQTTNLQYQPWKRGPWFGFTWRFDSGQVAGAVPYAVTGGAGATVDTRALTADQQFQAGLSCNGVRATPTQALPASCPAAQFASSLITIPAAGTENPDHNPPRMRSRSLFDLSVGDDNLFRGSRYKWSAQFTIMNLTDNYALYNFLSTFSGTHYVSPRGYTAQLGFHF